MTAFWSFIGTNIEPLFHLFVNIMVLVFQGIILKGFIEDYFKDRHLRKLKYDRGFALITLGAFILVMILSKLMHVSIYGLMVVGTINSLLIIVIITLVLENGKAKLLNSFITLLITIWGVGNIILAVQLVREGIELWSMLK
ncbi:hypothetical protein [Bacillus toyonensis]|uniref:hypothetical protein n=1 Tax=Bacillus toyonensis TaxID=155322 RepID=UPI000BF318C7|nr:hypothetical protein [Bacillus toyonensis]PGF05183.1 hypothetical protein COM61_01810 [Bacillus toyonensis]